MIFSEPLILFSIPILLAGLMVWLKHTRLFWNIPSTEAMMSESASKNFSRVYYGLPLLFLALALLLFLLALANPQKILPLTNTHVDGVGIMLLMDLSGSMEAEDFLPKNRITVSKKVIQDFILRRANDLLGLVVFGTDAFLVSPLSSDHRLLLEQIGALSIGQIDGKTAIGTAIVKGANHLRDVRVKSKVMILLTDGENNSGDIDPITAAHLTAALGIKIYTIGIGKPGGAPIPVIHPVYGKIYARNPDGSVVLSKLDEETLKQISGITGGSYFRAVDSASLRNVYATIDQMEKSKIQVNRFVKRESVAMPFLWAGALALICYILLEFFIFKVAR